MSSNALALRQPQELRTTDDYNKLGQVLATSGYFADARSAAQAAVKVMAGAELGIPPIASMMGIHIVKGKAVLGGNLIASRIKAHGYDYRIKRLDTKGCVIAILDRASDGKRELLGESSFEEADAKAAGLLGNDNYAKYARNMYFNRAVSNAAKWFVPDVLAGLPVYTGEELGATVDEAGDVVITQADVARERIAEETAKAAAARPAPQPQAVPASGPKTMDTPNEAEFERQFRAADKYGKLKCFKALKEQYCKLLGKEKGEMRYYDHLSACDAEHADKFKTLADAIRCAKAMYRDTEALMAGARAFDATATEGKDDWVPEFGGSDAS